MSHDYRDVLLKAASRVEQEGMWYQGWLWPNESKDLERWSILAEAAEVGEHQPACAVGQLAIATVALNGDFRTFDEASGHLAAVTDPDIGWWNDRPGRTAFEVAEAMRRAAE